MGFSLSYIIAHEVGHHVQNLLGLMPHPITGESSVQSNRKSVLIELQADCFAGVWAKETQRTKQTLENGDIEEALTAAAAVGDDRLQMKSEGTVVPDSFTHGTSEQRMTWFKRGFAQGSVSDCDTSRDMWSAR